MLKNTITIYILIFATTICSAQNQYGDIIIRIGCGWVGTTSDEFVNYSQLIRNKNYKDLKENLTSPLLFNQLLSALSLEELSKLNLVTLTQTEKEQISRIKNSKKTYYLCEGCTGHYYGTIYDIFHDVDENLLKTIKIKIGLK